MPQDVYHTWQDFARAASVEQDSKKLVYLIQQLNHALDEHDRKKYPMQMRAAQQGNLSASQ